MREARVTDRPARRDAPFVEERKVRVGRRQLVDRVALRIRAAPIGKIELKWDERSGIPTAVGVDPDLQTLDDEIPSRSWTSARSASRDGA